MNDLKIFTKRQLLDQCGFTAEETKLILEYQKRLLILVENEDVEGFCVNVRDLYCQLNESSDITNFSRWMKRLLKNYKFIENIDFKPFSPNGRTNLIKGGDTRSKDYLCTIDMAKQIALVNKCEIGILVRRYFILMEKAVKRNIQWELVRYPLRQGYKEMDKALDSYMMRQIQRHADDWDYKLEANALNIIATGFDAQEIRNFVKCQDNNTRDSLTVIYNEYLLKLQELNIIYLGMDMNRYDRYSMLKKSFDILFPNAIPIKDDIDIQRIINNKENFLNEVKMKIEGVA